MAANVLERAENRGLRIIWIPIGPCRYFNTPIAKYQAAIDPSKPLVMMTRASREQALAGISEAIGQLLESSS